MIEAIQTVVSVPEATLELILASLAAGGHVILADTHGVGKTSLARAVAGSIRWPDPQGAGQGHSVPAGEIVPSYFNRIQCTVDLLPQDILGYSRLVGADYRMEFLPGPIFSHFLLCDEINLLTPKTQGGFFQAMEERAVSIEGRTYPLPKVFFLIATMNLRGSHLFPLPAPQLDRFMVQLSLGYPDPLSEAGIISRHGREDAWEDFSPVIDYEDLASWGRKLDKLDLHPEVLDYLVRAIRASREHPQLSTGASPRTGVKLSRLARALCLVRGEGSVSIDTIKEIFIPGVAHRIEVRDPATNPAEVLAEILASLPVEPGRKARQSGRRVWEKAKPIDAGTGQSNPKRN